MSLKPPRAIDVQPSFLRDDDLARGRDGDRKVPVPMLPSEIVRIETAMFFGQVSDKTIRSWAHKDGIGRQAEKHSPLQISLPALLMKVDGQTETLERLRAGHRGHPLVVLYLRRAICLLEEIRIGGRL
jgi:hypothetical protein